MLILFCINFVKFEIVWLIGKRELHSFWDGGSTFFDMTLAQIHDIADLFALPQSYFPFYSQELCCLTQSSFIL